MAKYCTPDDYKDYFGEDLNLILGGKQNESNKANAFLTQEEDVVESFINANFSYTVESEYPTVSDFQKKHWKLAILWQANYNLYAGAMHSRSGFVEDKGFVATPSRIESAIISPQAREHLIQCGLWNTHINPHGVIMGNFYNGSGGLGI